MEKYEYKVITFDTKGFFGGKIDTGKLEDQLNTVGSEGWELMSATSTNEAYGASKSVVCIFKRKKDQ